jgi:hypothetical protein
MGPHDVEAAKEPPVTVRDLQAAITSSLAASLQRLGSRAPTRLGVTGVRTFTRLEEESGGTAAVGLYRSGTFRVRGFRRGYRAIFLGNLLALLF